MCASLNFGRAPFAHQVGDRFDTDVRGGLSASLRTCLVESGCHNKDCQRYYRTDPADYYVASIDGLIPQVGAAGVL